MNCGHMARVDGYSGLRVCQRKPGHDAPHSYFVDEDEVRRKRWIQVMVWLTGSEVHAKDGHFYTYRDGFHR
jgi:hypothetical protein